MDLSQDDLKLIKVAIKDALEELDVREDIDTGLDRDTKAIRDQIGMVEMLRDRLNSALGLDEWSFPFEPTKEDIKYITNILELAITGVNKAFEMNDEDMNPDDLTDRLYKYEELLGRIK